MTDNVVNVDVDFSIRPLTGVSEETFTMHAGADPFILIAPVESYEDDEVSRFVLDSTGISREELVWVLEAIAHTLKSGEITL